MNNNQDGVGFIGMIMSLFVIGLIAWFIYGQYFTDGDDVKQSSQELIEDAQDSVDKANNAKQRAEDVIELTN